MYKGNAPCLGCGKTGEEKPRHSKDSLCYDCIDLLNIGRATFQEKERERKFCFELFIKNSIEDEFADVIIRLLDMAYELYGESMEFDSLNCFGGTYFGRHKSFIENAWVFTRNQLGHTPYEIKKAIQFMLDWSDYLKIDIYKHIELKMKYNELREYKHGNKKY